MANFGKLAFAVSLAPQTAFPLDARYYFSSLEEARAAAAGAVEVGSSDGTYFIGENIVVVTETEAKLYVIQPDKSLKEVGTAPQGDGITINVDENGKIGIAASLDDAENVVDGASLQLAIDSEGNKSVRWKKPSATTVEGLDTRITSVEEKVGDSTTGLVKDVNDLKAVKTNYSIKKLETAEGSALATYELQLDGVAVEGADKINIPKDFLVKSGSVVVFDDEDVPEGLTAGVPYIKLVINTKEGSGEDEPLYIAATDLVDVYTGADGAEITVSVADNKISATLKDGAISKNKLDELVQASLGKADSALQSADIENLATKDEVTAAKNEAISASATAIATAKQEAIDAAAEDAASKDSALKTAILGEGNEALTVPTLITNATTPLTTRIAAVEDSLDNYVSNETYEADKATFATKSEIENNVLGAKIDGADQEIAVDTDHKIKLPLAAADKFGLVKGNGTEISTVDGVVSIVKVNLSKIEQTDGDELILNCN